MEIYLRREQSFLRGRTMFNLKSWPEFCHEILDVRGIKNYV